MPTIDELYAQRDALRRTLRSGALEVRHGEKSVKYRTAADLQAALSDVQREIAEFDGKRPPRLRYHTFHASKGLG